MKILITGGAGFIGSHLCRALLEHPEVSLVRVLDNFSTGFRHNLDPFKRNTRFELIEGDIADYKTCQQAMQGINRVSHQAALGSVPRSIHDPVATHQSNCTGTLHIYDAAREAGANRVVYAASSSTYGDSTRLPKVEDEIGKPLSPYAVTKYVMELYADVFAKTYQMEFIGLRYFNVFGPYQSPEGAYAAVIPLFIQALLENRAPLINGDGSYSRDFTYVDNVVQANLLALFTNKPEALNQVYNVAYGSSTTLLQLFEKIRTITGKSIEPQFGPFRLGDIPHSQASIEKAKNLLGYHPEVSVDEGLLRTVNWFAAQQ